MLLGVAQLESTDVAISIVLDKTEPHPSSAKVNGHLQKGVPYIYALRLGEKLDENGREQSLLSRARLHLCRRIAISVNLLGQGAAEIVLSNNGESIRIGTDLYLIEEYNDAARVLVRFWQSVANLLAELVGTEIAAEAGNVLRCQHEAEMEEVVRGLLTEGAEAALTESRARFARSEDPDLPVVHKLPFPPAASRPAADGARDGEVNRVAADAAAGPPETAKDNTATVELSLEPISGPHLRPRMKRRLVVTRTPSAAPARGHVVLASEAITLPLVMAYEELAVPKRYPIPVEHIHGSEGFGCDILSLKSEQARERAKKERLVSPTDIERFIEVKGRSSRSGAVELTDNQLATAEQQRGRYFIYRVFCDPHDQESFELAILADPLYSQALQRVPRFNLFEGSGAVWLSISEQTGEEEQEH
jgi:hypothetical protein